MAVKQAGPAVVGSAAEAFGRMEVAGDSLSWRDRWLQASWWDGTYEPLPGDRERIEVAPARVELSEVVEGLRGHPAGGVVLVLARGDRADRSQDGPDVQTMGEFVGELFLSEAEAQALALALLARVRGRVWSSFADRGNTESLQLPPAAA